MSRMYFFYIFLFSLSVKHQYKVKKYLKGFHNNLRNTSVDPSLEICSFINIKAVQVSRVCFSWITVQKTGKKGKKRSTPVKFHIETTNLKGTLNAVFWENVYGLTWRIKASSCFVHFG